MMQLISYSIGAMIAATDCCNLLPQPVAATVAPCIRIKLAYSYGCEAHM